MGGDLLDDGDVNWCRGAGLVNPLVSHLGDRSTLLNCCEACFG